MSIRDLGRFHLDLSSLSIWRKLSLLVCLVAVFAIGTMAGFLDISIYYSAPVHAAVYTQETHPVHVMHGSLRFVTDDKAQQLHFWREQVAPLIGIPFVAAFLIAFTSAGRIAHQR
jgi:hypothetical protein